MLLYSIPALNLKVDQLNDLNVAWNNIYRYIFGFQKYEPVKVFIAGIGYTDLKHIWLKLYLTFIRNGLQTKNSKIKYLTQRHYLSEMKLNLHKFNMDYENLTDNLAELSDNEIKSQIYDKFAQS